MSRESSTAFAWVERANIALENVLLNELRDKSSGSLAEVTDRLHESRSAISRLRTAIDSLRGDMDKHHFEDLPTLHVTDLEKLGEQFAQAGLVQEVVWKQIIAKMGSGGFYAMLWWFNEEINRIDRITMDLMNAVAATESDAKVGQLNLVLEENRPGNFKVEFAQLYTAWLRFQQVFLASSMLSTELWYRYCGVGSLLGKDESVAAA
ncbi:MAG TPA: hypothetical protein VGA06_00105 [Candidatus Paceibacterota bacterium]|jgi:hypothetical protein